MKAMPLCCTILLLVLVGGMIGFIYGRTVPASQWYIHNVYESGGKTILEISTPNSACGVMSYQYELKERELILELYSSMNQATWKTVVIDVSMSDFDYITISGLGNKTISVESWKHTP